MRTKARHVVVVAFEEVELLDLAAPLEVLSAAGRRWNFRPYKITVAAVRPGLVATRGQLRVEASAALESTEPAEILIVPGGYGARRAAEDDAVMQQLPRLAASAEVIAGIGFGTVVLARAGLCAQARVAAAPEIEAELVRVDAALALERSEALVNAGRLLTARGSGAAISLALEIVKLTMGPKLVSMVATDLGLELPAAPNKIEIRY